MPTSIREPTDQPTTAGASRAERSTRHQAVAGAGNGFPVVTRIVGSGGGCAGIESREGDGATFHVLRPRVVAGEPAAAP